jgi:hypothetical protein
MSTKRVFLSPYQLGALDGFSEAFNISPIFDHLPRLDGPAAFYATMLQSGAEFFSVPDRIVHEIPQTELLAGRVQRYEPTSVRDISDLLTRVLGEPFQSLRDERTGRRAQSIDSVRVFLEDLLVAARRRESFVSVLPTPRDSLTVPGMAPEVGMAVSCLFAEFTDERVDAPVPRLVIDRGAVARFEEIISSDVFRRYASTHAVLEDASYDASRALEAVKKTGRDLELAFEKHLDRSVLGMGLLTLTPKILDLAFGRLPSILAEFATKLVEPLMKERRRIVVYRLDGVLKALMEQRMRQVANHPPPPEVMSTLKR